MTTLLLLSGVTYTFIINQFKFGKSEFMLVDGSDVEISSTSIWATESKKIYTGSITRQDNKVFEAGTNRQLTQFKLSFGISVGSQTTIFIKDRITDDRRVKLVINTAKTDVLHPELERFIIQFKEPNTFNPDIKMVNHFIDNWIPSSLIPVQST